MLIWIFTIFNYMKMDYVRTIPVYPNKWRFFMAPLMKDPELLEFNWFLCAQPFVDDKGNKVIDVNRYSLFFDPKSGKSYHTTFDATEKDPCVLMIVEDKCDKVYQHAIKQGYCGIATRVDTQCKCDLTCQSVEFFFNRKVVEESGVCPYIKYALTHARELHKHIKGFPSLAEIKKFKPGKASLRLKKLLTPYFKSL